MPKTSKLYVPAEDLEKLIWVIRGQFDDIQCRALLAVDHDTETPIMDLRTRDFAECEVDRIGGVGNGELVFQRAARVVDALSLNERIIACGDCVD